MIYIKIAVTTGNLVPTSSYDTIESTQKCVLQIHK